MIDNKIMSKDWVYENVYGLSPDQYEKEKELILKDNMTNFRYSQIENEGNDPVESGMSYGTPHDLATAYGNKRDKAVGPAQVPTGYDEKEPGRPVTDPKNYGSDKGNLSRDPLGKKDLKSPEIEKPTGVNKVSTFEIANIKKSLQKIQKKKKILVEEEENGLLSEKNIKPQE